MATQQSRDNKEVKQSKAISSLPHLDDWQTSIGHTVTHNKTEQLLQNPTMGATINN